MDRQAAAAAVTRRNVAAAAAGPCLRDLPGSALVRALLMEGSSLLDRAGKSDSDRAALQHLLGSEEGARALAAVWAAACLPPCLMHDEMKWAAALGLAEHLLKRARACRGRWRHAAR